MTAARRILRARVIVMCRILPSPARVVGSTRTRSPLSATKDRRQGELDRVEGLGAHGLLRRGGESFQVSFGRPAKDSEGEALWVEQPVVWNGRSIERAQLAHRIVGGVGRGQDLADPVGSERDRATSGTLRASAPTPSNEVVAVHLVRPVLHLHLRHEPPATWTATSERGAERPEKHAAQGKLGAPVLG